MTATGIVPRTIAQVVGQRAATIQDKWFARLFLVKALVIVSLAAVLDGIRLHLAGDFLRRRRGNFALPRLSGVAGRAGDRSSPA